MKFFKTFAFIKSELLWQTLLLLSPFIFLAIILPFRNSISLMKLGLIFQIFTLVPLILPFWEKLHRSVWHFDWYVMHLGNLCNHLNWIALRDWLRKNEHDLSRYITLYLLGVSALSYLAVLVMQLIADL